MEWNWLNSIVFGFLSGFGEFLPVSADAHVRLFACLTGAGESLLSFRLVCRVSILAALLIACRTQLRRIARERRIAAAPPKRRKRQPDRKVLMDLRALRTAAIPVLLAFAAYPFVQFLGDQLWILALLLLGNGVILFLPQFFPSGNKESQGLSPLDSLLVGLGGALAVLPGISRIGALTSAGRLRGTDGRHGAQMALLLCIPALTVLIGFDLFAVMSGQAAFTASFILYYFLAAIASFTSAYFGILLMRFLAVKVGFTGFSYYCWGAALLTFVLYLMI